MKIKDIVLEAPGSYQDAYNKASSLFSPGKAITNNPEYQAGYNKTKNIFSPTKWGKGSAAPVDKTAAPKNHVMRDTIARASQGQQLYQDDINTLKQVYNNVATGKLKTNVNQTNLLAVLKLAYTGKQLNDSQRAVLAQFSQQF